MLLSNKGENKIPPPCSHFSAISVIFYFCGLAAVYALLESAVVLTQQKNKLLRIDVWSSRIPRDIQCN